MFSRRRSVGLVAAVSIVVAALGATVATAQQDDAPPEGTGDAALLARLDALEPQLPSELAPSSVDLDPDASWGSFEGDVTGAAATLGTLERDLLSLFVDADDAGTEVADAVADVARGWLDLQQAYEQLAVWEAADLAFPIDASDSASIATDADELAGRAEAGLRIVLGASQRQLAGYVALRALGEADPGAQERFDGRAAAAEAFDQDIRPLIAQLLAVRTTQVMVPVERFETSAPGVEARARSMTVTCIDRQTYLEATTTTPVEGLENVDITDPAAVLGLLDPSGERADCPGLAEEQDVRVRD